MRRITAVHDPRIELRIITERDLLYTRGPDAELDRPAHVRAASGLGWLGNWLAVIQDDTNFVALVDPVTFAVESVTLPAVDGVRQFDVERGNKQHKLDLESCFTVERAGETTLVALGSGSTTRREAVVLVTERDAARGSDGRLGHVEQHSSLYGALRACPEFSGSELNVEGAVSVGDRVRLFQRGNGASKDGVPATNASADLPLTTLFDPSSEVTLENVIRYDLGDLGGVPLTFTDVASVPGAEVRTLFLATAEASTDTYSDGVVTGTVAGIIEGDRARYGFIREPSGERLARKAEGILVSRSDSRRAYVAFDPDDHRRPATLAEATLEGPWF